MTIWNGSSTNMITAIKTNRGKMQRMHYHVLYKKHMEQSQKMHRNEKKHISVLFQSRGGVRSTTKKHPEGCWFWVLCFDIGSSRWIQNPASLCPDPHMTRHQLYIASAPPHPWKYRCKQYEGSPTRTAWTTNESLINPIRNCCGSSTSFQIAKWLQYLFYGKTKNLKSKM